MKSEALSSFLGVELRFKGWYFLPTVTWSQYAMPHEMQVQSCIQGLCFSLCFLPQDRIWHIRKKSMGAGCCHSKDSPLLCQHYFSSVRGRSATGRVHALAACIVLACWCPPRPHPGSRLGQITIPQEWKKGVKVKDAFRALWWVSQCGWKGSGRTRWVAPRCHWSHLCAIDHWSPG